MAFFLVGSWSHPTVPRGSVPSVMPVVFVVEFFVCHPLTAGQKPPAGFMYGTIQVLGGYA